MSFDFASTTDAMFGFGRARELHTRLLERGWCRPGFVLDGSLAKNALVGELVDNVRQSTGIAAPTLVSRSDSEPDYDYLDECASWFRTADIDSMVGIGGGSAMDLCKGISLLMTNPGRGLDYRGMDRVKTPRLPCVLLPTTAGTGSEATFTVVFVDRDTKTKLGINGRHVGCDLAILDPALTASCPHRVAVGSGLDAMVHSLEAFMTTGTHPIVNTVAKEAWRHLFQAFPAAVNDPSAVDARLEMLIGSYLAGITLRYSGGGIAGALSYPLGGDFGVPHGLAGGLLLPHIIRTNVRRGYLGFAELHAWVFPHEAELTVDDRSTRFADRFDELFEAIGAPLDFTGYTVQRSDIPAIVDQSLRQRAAVLEANPIRPDDELLVSILESVVPA